MAIILTDVQLNRYAALALEGARKYPKHSDPTRGVPLDDDEKDIARRNQTCVTLSDTAITDEAKRVLQELFKDVTPPPARERRSLHVNIAGCLGVSEISLKDFQEGKLGTVASDYKAEIEGRDFQVGMGSVFRKLSRYNKDDHNHTFPEVRGEASGTLEAAKILAAEELGFDVLANDMLDVGLDKTMRGTLEEYLKEKNSKVDFVVIARAVTPDQAWALVQDRGDTNRFTEENVRHSARKFVQSMELVLHNVPNAVLLNKDGLVIFEKSNGKVSRCNTREITALKSSCDLQSPTYLAYNSPGERMNAAREAGVEYADGPTPPGDEEIADAQAEQARMRGGRK